MQTQKCFSLIELVMVIVITGILAAMAIPKLVDMTGDAAQSAVDYMSATLGSANVANVSGCYANNDVPKAKQCVKVNSCVDVGLLVVPNQPLSTTVTSADGVFFLTLDNAVATSGAQATCAVNVNRGKVKYTNTVNFAVTGAGYN